MRWSTGARENPYLHRVTSAETITATFVSSVSVDEVDMNTLSVVQNGLMVSISNPQGLSLVLYDIQGRQLYAETQHTESLQIQLPAKGVYLLRCGASVRKIVAL